jgi:GH15 family glucan-1,4-alpha-glucosidase
MGIEKGNKMQRTEITRSIDIIKAGQTASGAYIASPYYPTYQYCWFRDGTFIANAMDNWRQHESARRFYDWATGMVVARVETVAFCLENVAQGLPLDRAAILHTRYTVDGQMSSEEWPNFQLDGFGTLLWGLRQHLHMTGMTSIPATWARAIHLLIQYLAALWNRPNYDCWEEYPDHLAVSTLAALYAGLCAISTAAGLDEQDAAQATTTAYAIRIFTLHEGVRSDHLIKQIAGKDMVDASLLWACVPFQEHGLLQPQEPRMMETARRIEQDLIGRTGGVHRYAEDTYYGGGEWMLLTALLGEYRVAVGDVEGARRCLAYVEAHMDEQGYLPEQDCTAPLYPSYVQPWIERWGQVACPLLWSHGAYLSLCATLG